MPRFPGMPPECAARPACIYSEPVRPLMFLSALVLFAPQTPPLQVTASDGRVTIRATRVPLFEILQELARKTGMEVVYESALPRQPITATLENLPDEDAIAKLLEGVPLSWGVKLSANRQRVERLVLADPSRRGGTVPPPRVPADASYPSEPMRGPVPSPTPTPTPRPTPTPTSKPTPSPTATPTSRPIATPTPASKPAPTPKPTAKPTPTPAPRS
jgi:hypothetical protein